MRVDESSSDFCLYGKEDGELALDRLCWYQIIRMCRRLSDVYPTDVVNEIFN